MYHVRQLEDGFTVRQLTANYPTLDGAKFAAKKAEKITGEAHTVCESLEPTDKRNVKGEGRFGFIAVEDDNELNPQAVTK